MTFRSIVIGLLFGAFIALFTYFNDWVLLQSNLASNLVPTIVYGVLVLGLLVGSPWVSPGLVPWRAFRRTLTFWGPLTVLFVVGTFCMAMVVHRRAGGRVRHRRGWPARTGGPGAGVGGAADRPQDGPDARGAGGVPYRGPASIIGGSPCSWA